MGDVVITLPYLQSLKNNYPGTRIDLLTSKETDNIPKNLMLFGKVFSIGGGRNFEKRMMSALVLLPLLLAQRYEMVIDIQRNALSRWIRKLIRPLAWSEFDKFSRFPAGERYREAIEAAGFKGIQIARNLKLKDESAGHWLLKSAGWQPGYSLVLLNPAGFFETRNWPLNNYIEFARLWLNRFSDNTQFLLLGVDSMNEKAEFLSAELHPFVINLVGKTTPAEAFSILPKVDFVLTEDSGLMHIAWVTGRPTLALFGSSRSDWSAPLGDHSVCLSSADLPCGECMEAVCRFGDVHCLTRYSPEQVFHESQKLLLKLNSTARDG